MSQYTILAKPKYVGYFDLYGIRLHMKKKPFWLHRFMLKLVFGIIWKNEVPTL
jgi:hypothetical protein